MAMSRPEHSSGAPATAVFTVVLSYRGAYKGMVGPFAEEAAAAQWAAVHADAAAGWSWEIEPVIAPAALAGAVGAAAPAPSAPRHLRVVR